MFVGHPADEAASVDLEDPFCYVFVLRGPFGPVGLYLYFQYQ
jgi:hypothetical protein